MNSGFLCMLMDFLYFCISFAGMKELMQRGEVSEIAWVPTDKQLADCMTKKGKGASDLLEIAEGSKSKSF